MKSYFYRSQVWDRFENSPGSQHVYGLTTVGSDTVLAFTEARLTPRDDAPHHLVLKRGTVPPSGPAEWSDNLFLERGDDGTCWANPAALTDRITRRAFIFYVANEGGGAQSSTRVFCRESDDGGRGWSPRRELTELFADHPCGWTFHMPGPGHGIQLTNQRDPARNGRLLLQFWHRRGIHETPRQYGVSTIFSDDHGRTWQRGGTPGAIMNQNESRLAETTDGTVILNTKGQNIDGLNNHRCRLTTFSSDGGLTFTPPETARHFDYCGCDSGLIPLRYRGEELLLLSHPADPESRRRLGISVSRDSGRSWSYLKTIDDAPCQYSDLTSFPDGSLGLLYGDGEFSIQRTQFARFSPEWLFNEE